MKQNINMKFLGKHLNLIGILLLTVFVGAAAGLYFDVPARLQNATRKSAARQKYACPMHADAMSAKPGNCPKCGMALTLASASSTAQECGSHDSGCCAKPVAAPRSLPPGHPPVDGYPAPVSAPGCTNHSH